MKQLNNIRQFSVILLLLSLLPLCVQAQTTESKEYTIVNNVDDLSDGDHIIIVSKYSTAMIGKVNTNSNSQRLLSTEITLNADKTLAYTNSDAACFTLVKTNDKFNFRSNEGKFINNVSEKTIAKTSILVMRFQKTHKQRYHLPKNMVTRESYLKRIILNT